MQADNRDARVDRRNFLTRGVAAAAVGSVALSSAGCSQKGTAADTEKAAAPYTPPPIAPPGTLPSIKLGEHTVSRLVAGWNPIGGHSHTTLNMARFMREYFTTQKTIEFMANCESKGINTWQYDHTDKAVEVLRARREAGSKLNAICLHAERSHDEPIKKVIHDTSPIALVHHGGVTDALFRAGRYQQVKDYVKKVQDAGVLAGVSSHCPDNIKRISDEGWNVDFFMTCFYYISRSREDQMKLTGKVTVGEPFFESDPEEMSKVVRETKKPCLAFKILAAGRKGWSRPQVSKAFRYAFENIKETDGVIVGMFPVYEDEVAANVKYTKKYGKLPV